MNQPLPGEVDKHLFECFLCKKRDRIFAFDWYGGCQGVERACVCHSCVREAVVNKLKEAA